MTGFSPSATTLLTDLTVCGIDMQPCGDTIRYRPMSAVTPLMLERLRTHKAELLAMLLIRRAYDLGNSDLAECMAEAWTGRLAIVTADGIPLAEAEQTALDQLRAMIDGN
jgi:hypothetical protein